MTTEDASNDLLRRLGGFATGGLEASIDKVDVGADRRKNSIEYLKQQMAGVAESDLSADLRERLLADAENGLLKLANEGNEATLSGEERFGVEAIIIADGSRPVLFVQDGRIATRHADLKGWQSKVLTLQSGIRSVISSVGRIDDPRLRTGYGGTGFVIDDGLIATNRHVLEAIGKQTTNGWALGPDCRIDFFHEFERDRSNSYKVESVIFAPPDRTGHEVNFKHLDLAVLQTGTGPDFPPPITLAEDSEVKVGADVFTVGYPAKPLRGSADVLSRLFANKFGFKRWAPGRVTAAPGNDSNDMNKWVFDHDVTTLGGSSGSCVVAFSGSATVCVGLHFSGRTGIANHAHVIAEVREQLAKCWQACPTPAVSLDKRLEKLLGVES